MAGVKPVFEELNGRDPVGVIVSANLGRRNLTVSQKAMLYAVAYPEPEKGGRGKKGIGDRWVSQPRISEARAVLHDAPDLVDGVIAGNRSLDAAYKTTLDRKAQAQSDEAKLARSSRTRRTSTRSSASFVTS